MGAATKAGYEEKLVCFELVGEVFGVPISMVQEIIRVQEITEIPRAPEFVEGVINLRGKIIPVIDLRKRFGLGAGEHSKNTRIVVIKVGDIVVGMVVDAVSEVIRLNDEDIEPPSPIVASLDAEYIKGVGKIENKLIILLDTEKILSSHEKAGLNLVASNAPRGLLEG